MTTQTQKDFVHSAPTVKSRDTGAQAIWEKSQGISTGVWRLEILHEEDILEQNLNIEND